MSTRRVDDLVQAMTQWGPHRRRSSPHVGLEFSKAARRLEPVYGWGPAPVLQCIVARLRTITPQVVPRELPWRSPEDRELLLSGLRMAAGDGS